MDEGNFITKYWLKRFEWYDWRFLIQLPLFLAYMYIGLTLMLLMYGLYRLAIGLDLLVNIKMWSNIFSIRK